MVRISFLAASAFLGIWAGTSNALAADDIQERDCGLRATVWGTYAYSHVEFDGRLGGELDSHGPSIDGAGLMTCGAWNIQLDGGVDAAFAEQAGVDSDTLGGSVGGKVFWRDPNRGAAGIFASYGFTDFTSDSPFGDSHFHGDTYSAGLFAQFFASESLTLGLAGGFDWDVATDQNAPASTSALETDQWFVAASAKYYVNPQFALALGGSYSRSDLWDSIIVTETISLRGGAEFLFANCGLAVFAGGGVDFYDYEFEFDEGPNTKANAEGLVIFAGLRYDFGPVPSLAERDRTGPISLSLLP